MNISTVRLYALSLPGATESPHHEMSSFRISGKIFATVPPSGAFLHVFVAEVEREYAVATESETCQKLFWGTSAVGLRIHLAKARPATVQRLLHCAWSGKAPRRLLKLHPAPILP